MSYKNYFSFLLLIFAALLFNARTAQACSCAGTSTVLDAFDHAAVVVVARVVGVDRREKGSDFRGIRSTKMVAEKVFKGNLKAGDEMIFGQGGGADCIWTFDEESIDKQFLFYLSTFEDQKMWFASTCGRSRGADYAIDDLMYLNNLSKVRGKTRISGTINFENETDLSVAGRKIRITGADKTYEVKTNEDGVYEIYNLPAGKYLIEPEVPVGWKIDKYSLKYSPSFIGGTEEIESIKRIPIKLVEKRHAGLDLQFEIDNAIGGRVFDPNGKPMSDVCIKAVKPQVEKDTSYHADCTDENGNFYIISVPSGSYVLVINNGGRISSSEPFGQFYYPNVFEREKAAVITIGPGETVEGLNIYAPQMEEVITIEGVFLYSDGKPVVDESVQFEPEKTKANVEGKVRATTDSNGRFSLRVLKGLKGKLFGGMYVYEGKFENCPKLDAIIKKARNDLEEIKTSAIEIQAEHDLYQVEIKYPFPGCKKAKVSP
jgi:hypothetical protein